MSFRRAELDQIFSMLDKRRRYLLARLLVYFILLVFTYLPTISSSGLTVSFFLNTTLFMIAPLFIEYIWGMDTYNVGANWNRILAFIITVIGVGFWFFGFLGAVGLQFNAEGGIESVEFFKFVFSIFWIKVYMTLTVSMTIFDFVFTLGPVESEIYKLKNEIDKDIKAKYTELTKKSRTEKVKDVKMVILEMIDKPKGEE